MLVLYPAGPYSDSADYLSVFKEKENGLVPPPTGGNEADGRTGSIVTARTGRMEHWLSTGGLLFDYLKSLYDCKK